MMNLAEIQQKTVQYLTEKEKEVKFFSQSFSSLPIEEVKNLHKEYKIRRESITLEVAKIQQEKNVALQQGRGAEASALTLLNVHLIELLEFLTKIIVKSEERIKQGEKNKVIPTPTPSTPPATTPPATQAPPTNTTPTISEKTTEGGPKVKDSHSGETSLTPTEKKEVSPEGTPKTEAPKKGFFTPTNIVILFLLFGAGVYFYNQKK